MKRFPLALLLICLVAVLVGCTPSAKNSSTSCECENCVYSADRELFATRLWSLADSPEGRVDVGLKYNCTEDLEDAFTKLCGYITRDWYVSANEAEDAWIYVSHYIDSLHAEIDELYRLYQIAY